MKKILAVLFILLTMTAVIPAQALGLYARAGVITEFDYENDIVYFMDDVSYIWAFYGIEDWTIGDIVVCIINDNGTEEILDDSILSTYYSGNTESLLAWLTSPADACNKEMKLGK